MSWIIQLGSAFFGAMGFAALFNVRGNRLLPASFGGMLAWGIYLLVKLWIPSDPIGYLIATIVLTVYSEALARVYKTPAILFTISGAIPMVPGGSLYNTMSYAVRSEWDAFMAQGIHTLLLALAIAVGILLTMSVWRVVQTLLSLKYDR